MTEIIILQLRSWIVDCIKNDLWNSGQSTKTDSLFTVDAEYLMVNVTSSQASSQEKQIESLNEGQYLYRKYYELIYYVIDIYYVIFINFSC